MNNITVFFILTYNQEQFIANDWKYIISKTNFNFQLVIGRL
jgi:hypothetical protein